MKRSPPLLTCLLTAFALGLSPCSSALANDWPHWRGPEQNGVSREKDLPERFSPDPSNPDSNCLWKQPYGCRSTPVSGAPSTRTATTSAGRPPGRRRGMSPPELAGRPPLPGGGLLPRRFRMSDLAGLLPDG